MSENVDNFIREAQGLLDDKRIYREPWALEPPTSDFWPLRLWSLVYGKPDPKPPRLPQALLLPENAEEVAEIVKLANRHGIGIRVVGAGSGVLGALSRPTPKPYVALDLSLLNHVEWMEKSSQITRAGAGLLWIDLEKWLDRQGYTTGHYPQSIELASVGGLIATGSSGTHSTGYGNIEELLKGALLVTGGGELLELRPSLREPLAPPHRRLLVGSEGQLAIVVEAYLQVHRKPPCIARQVYLAPQGLEQALEYLRELSQAPPSSRPAFLRAWDEYEATLEGLSGGQWGAVVGVEFHAPCQLADAVGKWAEDSAQEKGLDPLGAEPLEKWMNSRLRVFEKIAQLIDQNLWFETLEFSATWERLPETYKRVRESLLEIPGVISATAHVGHAYTGGAVLYFTVLAEASAYQEAYPIIWKKATLSALETRATPYHHHGQGQVRTSLPIGEPDELRKRVWEAHKRSWDPNNVLV